MAINIELGYGLDYVAFIIGIIYTLVPIVFFYQYSAGVIKPKKVSIFGILFLYLNGLTYFLATIQNNLNNKRTIELRDFTNLSGALLGLVYCLYYSYIIYFNNNKKRFYLCLGLTFGTLAIIILISFFVNTNILEYIAVVFNVLEYTPLGFNLIYLIRNKVSEKYTLFSAIPGIINTIIWLVWAIKKVVEEKNKYHSLVANVLGFLLCLLQFIMFFFFNKEVDDKQDNLIETKELKEDGKEEEGKSEEEKEQNGEIKKYQEDNKKKETSEFDDFL